MRKAERERREALTKFNRSAGQIKRYHPELNPVEYLEGKTTAKGIEKALDKLRFDAEQIEIGKRVEAYEKKLDIIYEEMLKQESIEKFEDERKRARESLTENYGLDWSKEDYDEFWDTFGDSDLIDFYGSDQIIYIGEKRMKEGAGLKPKKVAKIAKKVMKKLTGKGYTQKKAVDKLNRQLTKELNKQKRRTEL